MRTCVEPIVWPACIGHLRRLLACFRKVAGSNPVADSTTTGARPELLLGHCMPAGPVLSYEYVSVGLTESKIEDKSKISPQRGIKYHPFPTIICEKNSTTLFYI